MQAVARAAAVVGGVAIAGGLAACLAGGASSDEDADLGADGTYEVIALSSRPEMGTGSDALVAVDVPSVAPLSDVRVIVNGADVTGSFTRDDAMHRLVGLVNGLSLGRNDIAVLDGNATPVATFSIRPRAATWPATAWDSFSCFWPRTLCRPLTRSPFNVMPSLTSPRQTRAKLSFPA